VCVCVCVSVCVCVCDVFLSFCGPISETGSQTFLFLTLLCVRTSLLDMSCDFFLFFYSFFFLEGGLHVPTLSRSSSLIICIYIYIYIYIHTYIYTYI
jgi:hypothetical protein